MRSDGEDSALRYLDAWRIERPDGRLGAVEVRCADDRRIGVLNGLLVDPERRRVRYFVVQSPGWFARNRYLLPAELPVRLSDVDSALHVEADSRELASCRRFEQSSVPPFSDADLLDAIFPQRVA